MLQYPFSPFPVITTERLILRAMVPEDEQALFQLRTQEKVYQYTYGNVYSSPEQIRRFMKKIEQHIQERDSIFWAIAYKNHPALIGTICLWNFSTENKSIEIGYELHPDEHRKGIMQEAIVPVLEFGFSAILAQKIAGFPHRENTASLKLLEKFGFVRNTKTESLFSEEERDLTAYELYR